MRCFVVFEEERALLEYIIKEMHYQRLGEDTIPFGFLGSLLYIQSQETICLKLDSKYHLFGTKDLKFKKDLCKIFKNILKINHNQLEIGFDKHLSLNGIERAAKSIVS